MKQQKIIDCYNKTAEKYAENLFDELSKKPLDRILLKQFAEENASKGKMIDLGCGPGQTTRFLFEQGVKDIIGTDISEAMISKASELSPQLQFKTADILKINYPDKFFKSALAFYAIVHFTNEQLKICFKEINRILSDDGQFLFSFHIGNEIIHRDELFDIPVDIDFIFFQTETILALVKEAKFKVLDVIERYPYENVEHPSKRAYIRVEKSNKL